MADGQKSDSGEKNSSDAASEKSNSLDRMTVLQDADEADLSAKPFMADEGQLDSPLVGYAQDRGDIASTAEDSSVKESVGEVGGVNQAADAITQPLAQGPVSENGGAQSALSEAVSVGERSGDAVGAGASSLNVGYEGQPSSGEAGSNARPLGDRGASSGADQVFKGDQSGGEGVNSGSGGGFGESGGGGNNEGPISGPGNDSGTGGGGNPPGQGQGGGRPFGDRGHGNDTDGYDEENPGRGQGGPNAGTGDGTTDGNTPGQSTGGGNAGQGQGGGFGNAPDTGDGGPGNSGNAGNAGGGNAGQGQGGGRPFGDRGHGNDTDGYDEENPGRGQGGPNAGTGDGTTDGNTPGQSTGGGNAGQNVQSGDTQMMFEGSIEDDVSDVFAGNGARSSEAMDWISETDSVSDKSEKAADQKTEAQTDDAMNNVGVCDDAGNSSENSPGQDPQNV